MSRIILVKLQWLGLRHILRNFRLHLDYAKSPKQNSTHNQFLEKQTLNCNFSIYSYLQFRIWRSASEIPWLVKSLSETSAQVRKYEVFVGAPWSGLKYKNMREMACITISNRCAHRKCLCSDLFLLKKFNIKGKGKFKQDKSID